MSAYDVSSFTEEQTNDWINHSIVPGPVHNNYDVCDKSCYVATLEHVWRPKNQQIKVDLVDIYVVNHEDGQSVLHRQDSEWEGSYGSMSLESFVRCNNVSTLHYGIFNVLMGKGRLKWEKTN